MPIVQIDDRPVGIGKPGPVASRIIEVFHQASAGQLDRYKNWVEYVRD